MKENVAVMDASEEFSGLDSTHVIVVSQPRSNLPTFLADSVHAIACLLSFDGMPPMAVASSIDRASVLGNALVDKRKRDIRSMKVEKYCSSNYVQDIQATEWTFRQNDRCAKTLEIMNCVTVE